MLSKKAKVSLGTFGDEDDDTSVLATTVNTNEDEEFIAAEEEQLRRTRFLKKLCCTIYIMMLLYAVALVTGIMFIDVQNQTWQTIFNCLFWIVYLFPIFIMIWSCSSCYREYPEETTNCIMGCGKGIGFMVCCIPVVVLAVLPWILFFNFVTFDSWKVLILVSFAQLVFGWLGKFYFNKHCDEELISANLFAFGWKCALLHIFVHFFLLINAAFTFFGWVNMLAEILPLDPSGEPIFLSTFLGWLLGSVSMLVSMLVSYILGRCCWNGDTAYSRATSQEANNGITMVEIV